MPAVGDIATPTDILDFLDSTSIFSGTSIPNFVTAPNTDNAALSMPVQFFDESAYEIEYFFRFSIAGTGPFICFSKLKRATASGTTFFDPGNVPAVGSGQIHSHYGRCVVKVTAGDTQQTIVLTVAYASVGAPTALNLSAGSNAAKMRMSVRRIGLAADYPDAIELPTA